MVKRTRLKVTLSVLYVLSEFAQQQFVSCLMLVGISYTTVSAVVLFMTATYLIPLYRFYLNHVTTIKIKYFVINL